MKPIRTPNANRVFVLPGGTEENNLPLEVTVDEFRAPCLVSTWELTEEERQQIAEGHNLRLTIWGGGHPPVALAVDD